MTIRINRKRFLIVCILAAVILAAIIGYRPVSYTHLDVYKRQVVHSIVDYNEAMLNFQPGATAVFTVLRNGGETTVEVTFA